MEFRSVGGQKKYFKYAECEKGQILVQGKYVGTSPNKFGKDNHDFRPTDGGPTVCLNSAGHLNYLIDNNVQVGDMVQVTYDGKDILDQGAFKGKEVHKFDVAIADSEEQLDAVAVKEVQDKVEAKSTGTVDLSDLD